MPVVCCRRLTADQQLRLKKSTGTRVYNGPGFKFFLCPSVCKEAKVVRAELLEAMDYIKIKDTILGTERIEKGPQHVFLGANEVLVERSEALRCSNMEYVRVENLMTGAVAIQQGPTTWFPREHEKGVKDVGIACNEMEYVRAMDAMTGGMAIYRGPCVWFPQSHEQGEKRTAISLNSTQYMFVQNHLTRKKFTVQGPCCWFPQPYEDATEDGVMTAWTLKMNEYVRLLNTITGEIRCIHGEHVVFPNPEDKLLDGRVLAAVKLKHFDTCDVLDESTGEVRCVRGPTQFCLGPYERITIEKNALQRPHYQCGDIHLLCGVQGGDSIYSCGSPRGAAPPAKSTYGGGSFNNANIQDVSDPGFSLSRRHSVTAYPDEAGGMMG